MTYHQITPEERYAIAGFRLGRLTAAAIGRQLGRHRSTIGRELHRNRSRDGAYRPVLAQRQAQNRSHCAHRHWRFTLADLTLVVTRLQGWWSPEQIAGRLRRDGQLSISHETIYRYIWADQQAGGFLYTYLRSGPHRRRKRYGTTERRGQLRGKRPIGSRPAIVERRGRIGDWEMDTVLGSADGACVVTLVERKTGFLALGPVAARTTAATNQRTIALLRRQRRPVHTLTADNGTEFHGYRAIEAGTGATVYFATPHHAWERGTNENTNGLLRQYLPKRQSLAKLTQVACHAIARHLTNRPRKRLGSQTPEECYAR